MTFFIVNVALTDLELVRLDFLHLPETIVHSSRFKSMTMPNAQFRVLRDFLIINSRACLIIISNAEVHLDFLMLS